MILIVFVLFCIKSNFILIELPITVIISLRVQYRLSRAHSAGVDIQRYNRVILFNENFAIANTNFIEGFDAFEFIMEQYRSTTGFRKGNLGVSMDFDFDRLKLIGSEMYNPTLRSKISFTAGNAYLKVNNEFDIFGTKFRDIDASTGLELDNYNASYLGNSINVNYHDRDVRSVNRQRNILTSRQMISGTPAPEPMTEMIKEAFTI
jgi:hypothetical protein